MTKTKPFLSMCYGDPSATEVPPCCEAATKKLTFSTTSVLLLLDVPLSLSRGTIFRRQKNPRRGYRPKIAGILFVCNEPGRSIPYCALLLHGKLSFRKPVLPSPSSGFFVQRSFPIEPCGTPQVISLSDDLCSLTWVYCFRLER